MSIDVVCETLLRVGESAKLVGKHPDIIQILCHKGELGSYNIMGVLRIPGFELKRVFGYNCIENGEDKNEGDKKGLLKLKEGAKVLGISPHILKKLVKRGEISAYRINDRGDIRLKRENLREYLMSHYSPPYTS